METLWEKKLKFFIEFRKVTGFYFPLRKTNFLKKKSVREDRLFYILTDLYFSNRAKFEKLYQNIEIWIKKFDIEEVWVLGGYIYYIIQEFEKARDYLLKAIFINPENLDNWLDFAFVLRHLGEYKMSYTILFYYDQIIRSYIPPAKKNYKELRRVILKSLENA